MPPKRKRSVTAPPTPRTVPASVDPRPPSTHDIAARAYHLFLQRGGQHGRDQEDWLQAERELRSIGS